MKMNNDNINNRDGQLYLTGARGYSAYEVAVQNGFVGTEEEWLASLKGDKGDTGDTFDELTPEQIAEITGPQGKSAYQIAVDNGFVGTEQDWVNAYLSPEGYVRKQDVVDNLTSTETQKPLSAKQGKELKEFSSDMPVEELKLKNILSISNSETVLYGGYEHTYLQGFCYVNGNIVMALRSSEYYDNYVKLVEIKVSTNEVLRSTYLELNHANSITFKESTNKLYVASCNKVVTPGSRTPDNTIFIVDYTNFTIDSSIDIVNIPSGNRIRSVYYDNEEEVLYAGDIYDVFVIDESTSTITDTVSLDTTYIDTSITNQTIKKYKNMFIGLYLTYIAFWDLEGNFIRLSSIEQIQSYEHLGEVEDFDFDENGNIIMGTAHKLSPRLTYRNAEFYTTNFSKNISNVFYNDIFRSDTTGVFVYVDISSNETKEDGTETYPYKNLQRAFNIVKNSGKFCIVRLASGTYDNVYITGVNYAILEFGDDTTINGLEVVGSTLEIYPWETGNILTINGIRLLNSRIPCLRNCVINVCINENLPYYNYTIHSVASISFFQNNTINGNNTSNAVYFGRGSITALDTCDFYEYEEQYAIHLTGASDCRLFDCTFDETLSDTQHTILVSKGSNLYSRIGLRDKRNLDIYEQGRVYPSMAVITQDKIEHRYLGTVCDVDTHYTHMQLKIKYSGTNYNYQLFDFDLHEGGNFVANTVWINDTGIHFGVLCFRITNSKLSINENRHGWLSNGNYTYTLLDTNTPETTQNYASVESVTFYMK